MPINVLKDYIRHIQYRRTYRGCHIGFGTRIWGKSALGHNVRIDGNCRISASRLDDWTRLYPGNSLENCEIGSYSYLAPGSQLRGVTLGKFCSVGPECMAGTGEHPIDWISSSPVFFSDRAQCGVCFADGVEYSESRPIRIGNDVWLGARVFIRDGVQIGHGAVAAAGAVVAQDVPDYAVVGGVPARLIRYRFGPEQIAEMLALRWWDRDDSFLRAHAHLFRSSDVGALVRALGGAPSDP